MPAPPRLTPPPVTPMGNVNTNGNNAELKCLFLMFTVPSTVLSTLHAVTHLIVTAT